jgi:hypothetical protein
MRYCAGCNKLLDRAYLHHGKLYCGLCLNPDPDDDLLIRSRVNRIKAATARAIFRGVPLPEEPMPRAEGRLIMSETNRVIGCIEVEYPDGTRSLPVTGSVPDLALAQVRADDIWEDHHGRLRVRVYRFFADGGRTCICHLPPLG